MDTTLFLDLFKGTKNAMDICSSEELLIPGFLYKNLNHKFLDGWVSLVKLLRGWVVRNNTHPAIEKETHPSFHVIVHLDQLKHYVHLSNVRITGRGSDCIELVFNKYVDYIQTWKQLPKTIVKFSELYDDVYLLGESCAHFWYFTYSKKEDNCKIGRILKCSNYSQENVIELFDSYVYEIQSKINSTYEEEANPIAIAETFLRCNCEF